MILAINQCPFCWSTSGVYSSESRCVTCPGCGAHGPEGVSASDAVSLWNNRPIEEGLKHQLRRRGVTFPGDNEDRAPLYTCGACGEKVYFTGSWSPVKHMRQLAVAKDLHANCKPSIDGAGI